MKRKHLIDNDFYYGCETELKKKKTHIVNIIAIFTFFCIKRESVRVQKGAS